MLAETLSLASIEPSFAVEFIDRPYPQYHYYDCTCALCLENHRYFCGNLDCEYCAVMCKVIDSKCVDVDDLISLPEFMELPENTPFDDMIKYFCVECNDRISYDQWKPQADKKELCDSCLESQVFYCCECGDAEVDDDGDTCAACSTVYCVECGESEVGQEGDLCDYCEENQTDHIKYHMGDIVDSDDYDTVENCWIAPNGNMHYVPYCNHSTTSYKLGFNGVDHCERSGYIHVSVYWSRSQRFVHIPERPTHAQINTIREYCEAWGLRLPSCAAYTVISEEKHEVQKLQNLNPAWLMMKRVQRDLFYKLSGD